MGRKAPKTKSRTIKIEVDEHEKGAMFMRSVRAEGVDPTTDEKVEVAVNELGAGIIVTVGDRTITLHEFKLAEAVGKMFRETA